MEATPIRFAPTDGLEPIHFRMGFSRPEPAGPVNAPIPLSVTLGLVFAVRPTVGDQARRLALAMADYVHLHYHRPFSLSETAAAMRMNASYLSALFSETTGKTFHQYVEEYRIAKAKELLRNPLYRVCEVACATGYTSPNHFRDVFKARVGVPPSVWRNLHTSP